MDQLIYVLKELQNRAGKRYLDAMKEFYRSPELEEALKKFAERKSKELRNKGSKENANNK